MHIPELQTAGFSAGFSLFIGVYRLLDIIPARSLEPQPRNFSALQSETLAWNPDSSDFRELTLLSSLAGTHTTLQPKTLL